jgi:hypothetical protein
VTPQGADDPQCADAPANCGTAADCAQVPYGSCQNNSFLGYCDCYYGCMTDADCGPGQICACAGVIGPLATCIPADCITDADCGDDLCGVSKFEECCWNDYQLACAGPNEECHSTAECSEGPCDASPVMYQCNFDGVGWTCNQPGWCSCDGCG